MTSSTPRRRWARCLAAAALASLLAAPLAVAQQAPGYTVIVNPDLPVQDLDRDFVARAFLKKVVFWPDHTAIQPVDQEVESAVRRAFTLEVLGRPVSAVRNGWVQAIFDGSAVPPPELDSDARVVEFVLQHRGAIGYVSPHAALRGARAVAVR